MTEEIVIDGVNVAGCEYFDGFCMKRDTSCEESGNCIYKQLKRLEQENKELKELDKKICEDCEKEIKVYWNALEEIKHILEIHKDELEECLHNDIDGMIQNKINEVLE